MMSDFEQRLADVLAAGSGAAPHDAGLAAAARSRRARRRRRRVALGAAAALVVAVPAAVAVGDHGEPDHTAVTDPGLTSDASSQTLERDDVRVEAPAGWRRFDCANGFEVYGPGEEDACRYRTALAFYSSATFDAATGPGVITRQEGTSGREDGWGGYITANDWAVWVVTGERDLTRRILASVRVEGEPEVSAARWTTGTVDGRTYDVPEGWGVGADDAAGYLVRKDRVRASDDEDGAHQIDPTHYERYRGGVDVIAPTRAVADLVLGSLQPAP